jgi:uncharacterized delta-60 repeat protein
MNRSCAAALVSIFSRILDALSVATIDPSRGLKTLALGQPRWAGITAGEQDQRILATTYGESCVYRYMRRTHLILLSLLALALALALVPATSASAAAHADRGYGKNGVVTLPGKKVPGQSARKAVAIEPSGALILATNRTLQRLDPAGHLDPTFGEGGTVTPPALAGGELTIGGVAVDGQGRIVVVATSTPPQTTSSKELPLHLNTFGQIYEERHSDVRILRYLPSGTLDPSFGQGGVVETDFGLPAPEYEGVKLAAAPVVKAGGVAVDGAGNIVVTGAALSSVTTFGCAHDDYGAFLVDAAYVARLTEVGAPDTGFGSGGLFGGRSYSENPLYAENAVGPLTTPAAGIIFRRGPGHCPLNPSLFGVAQLTPTGSVGPALYPEGVGGYVTDTAVAPDGSVFLLIGTTAAGEPQLVEKLDPGGTLDPAFGEGGKVTLRLPGRALASHLRVAADGEVLVEAIRVPRRHRHEDPSLWRSRFAAILVGLTTDGARDPRIGPHGIVSSRVPVWYETSGFWLDAQGRATLTAGYRIKRGPVGLMAVRFITGA